MIHTFKWYFGGLKGWDFVFTVRMMYGVVRDFEAISYQLTPTFFTSHKEA